MSEQELGRIDLQRRARPRQDGEAGAFDFNRWLELWQGRDDVRVRVGFVVKADGTLGDAAYAVALLREPD